MPPAKTHHEGVSPRSASSAPRRPVCSCPHGPADTAVIPQAAEARADALHNAGDPKPALDSCIRAAELYIQARHEAATPAERDALERRCADVLAKAERWKAAARSTSDAGTKTTHAASPPPYTPKKRPPPESTSKLSVKEETLLLRSSKINGGIYPPWKANPELAEFAGEEDQFLCVFYALAKENKRRKSPYHYRFCKGN